MRVCQTCGLTYPNSFSTCLRDQEKMGAITGDDIELNCQKCGTPVAQGGGIAVGRTNVNRVVCNSCKERIYNETKKLKTQSK